MPKFKQVLYSILVLPLFILMLPLFVLAVILCLLTSKDLPEIPEVEE